MMQHDSSFGCRMSTGPASLTLEGSNIISQKSPVFQSYLPSALTSADAQKRDHLTVHVSSEELPKGN